MIELSWPMILVASAVFVVTSRLIDRRTKRYERRLVEAERRALNATVEWAYIKGRIDQHLGVDADEGRTLIIYEFRATFGDDLREAR